MTLRTARLALHAVVVTLSVAACGGGGGSSGMSGVGFSATALVSDAAASVYATQHTDANLVNGWGVAMNPAGFAWVADAGTSKSTLYNGFGERQAPIVALPGNAMPTGIVFNPSLTEFRFGAPARPAQFVFAGLAGTIAAWSPDVDATHAATVVDNGASGSVYTGLALAQRNGAGFLYAADFAHARIDVFDAGFAAVTVPGGFVDPNLPAGYAPFGIQAIGGRILVAYAQVDPATHEERKGAGLGVLDAFDSDGHLLARLVDAGGALDAPWGIALAPAGFGPFGGALLVGNFGDGRIHAFDATSGAPLGTLGDAHGNALVVDGLWGLAFGNGQNALPTTTLFYAAGPADEQHGVFGRIDAN